MSPVSQLSEVMLSDFHTLWSGQVNAFVVRKDNPGYSATKIENKIALRCVQNADIKLTRCFVSDADRLPGVNSFQDTNKVRLPWLRAWG